MKMKQASKKIGFLYTKVFSFSAKQSAGMGFEITLGGLYGKETVVDIEYHAPCEKEARHYCQVHLSNGESFRVFNPDFVSFTLENQD